ncbi:YqeG family HAD IIIA-type phosphatase [Hutsoniella sourekii]|uniref:YqeG family HAD IIIA-type phosphatase n=1 Tax=Hutsoniella sourekii TaxID=87650 RepID=UPI0004836708|nr:YqeG family HAD IIIA-type phosphatase [Hutsoniella sourekii]
MKNYITPTWTINSPYDLTPQDLLARGIQAVIVDLDNTLLAWNQYEHTQEMMDWVEGIRQEGIGIYLLSNNNYDRVMKVAQPLDLDFSSGALKPRRKYFKYALDELAVDPESVVVIGDQIITDVIGANRNHLKSILVKPMVPHDNIYTWFNRTIEKLAFKIVGINPKEDWGNTLD